MSRLNASLKFIKLPQFLVLIIALGLCLFPYSWAQHGSAHALTNARVFVQPASGINQNNAVHTIPKPPANSFESNQRIDCSKVKCLALTFDDGPNPLTTPKVLSILEGEKVHASFFVVGSRIKDNESLLRRMNADGDEIGNHSWSHPDLTMLTPAQIRRQVLLTQAAIIKAGAPAPTLFRPPYGAIDSKVETNVPLTLMFWNEDPRDWAADKPQQVEAAVEGSAQPGGVVDMHDIYNVTADSLDPIIKYLKKQHYQFVTVSQLLHLQPGEKGKFFGE